MSYSSVKAGLLVQLQAVANFSASNVVGQIGGVINAGHDRFMVVLFDSFENRQNPVYGFMETAWQFQITLGEKTRADAADTEARFAADLVAIIARLNSYPELGGAALNAVVTRGENLAETQQFGSAEFDLYGLIVEATEIVSANYQE